MAQHKFLKPIVGGAIGLGILGIAGAVYASTTGTEITATGTGSGTSTTAVVYADSTLTCDAHGHDDDIIQIDWYSTTGGGTALQTTTQVADKDMSDVLASGLIVKGDTVTCTSTDDVAATLSDTVTVANAAPDAGTPEVSAIGGVGDSITCADGTTAPATDIDTADLPLSFTYQWGVAGVIVGGVTSATTTPATLSAVKGQAVTCRITASDGTDSDSADSAGATVLDTVPTATAVSVTPAKPGVSDTITCDYTYGDVDAVDTEGTSTFKWFVGGTEVGAVTTETTTPTALSATAGDVIDCQVTPVNTAGTGAARKASDDTGTATVNTPGVTSAVGITASGTGQTGDTLTCAWTFTDSDSGDSQAFASVEWFVETASVTTTTGVGTAASSTIVASAIGAARGQDVYCSVSASDDSGGASPSTAISSDFTIVDTLPVASAVTLDNIVPQVADTLTCGYTYADADNTTDAAVDAESGTTFEWLAGGSTSSFTGSSGTVGTNIGAVKGNAVRCKVTPSNTAGSGTQVTSTNTATVVNTAPDTPSAPTITTTGGANGTATCTWVFSDSDTADTQATADVAWYKNGSNVTTTPVTGTALTETATLSSTTGADLNLVTGGDALTCAVTVNDGSTDSAQSSQSSSVDVANSAPTATSTIVASGGANGTATCSWTYADADGNAQLGYSIDWFYKAPGVTLYSSTADTTTTGTTASTDSIDLSSSTGGDINGVSGDGDVKCEVSVTDSIGAGSVAAGVSGDATIANTVPTIHQSASQSTVGPLLSPSVIATGDTVTCVAFIEEIDIETTTWSMSFTDVGGTALSGGGSGATASGTVSAGTVATSTATISRSVNSSIDDYYCTVIVTDTDGAVTEVDSVSRVNTAPDQPTVTLSSSTPKIDDSVTCTWTYNDNDGDAQSGTVVAWLVDGTTQTSATYSGATTSEAQTMRTITAWKGSSVVCEVTPSDGSSSGIAGSSSAATVANTLPVASAVAVTETGSSTSAAPEVNDNITCDYTWTDADDGGTSVDSDSGTAIEWFVNSTSVGSITSQDTTATALGADHVSSGDVITCEVTPNDGTAPGTTVAGSSATVANSTPVATANIPIGTYTTGTTVTCNVSGQDDNAQSISGSVEFFIDSVSVGTTALTSFTGGSGTATSSSASYTLIPADGGKPISCTSTYTDALGLTHSATATASATNSVPTVTVSSLTPSSIFVGDTLTCVADVTDLDAQSITISRKWYSGSIGGSPVQTDSSVTWSSPGGSSATTAVTGTYVIDPTDVLDSVFCVVTADDGTDNATASDSVSVSNTAPTITASVSSSSGGATTGATLTCLGTANDPDSQTLSYTVDWTQSGVALVTSPSKTGSVAAPAGGTFTDTYVVTAADVAAGVPLLCEIDLDDGTTVSSTTGSISTTNTPPALTGAPTLSPSSPTIAAPVNCVASATDIDSDTITYGYAWTYDGTALSTLSSSTTATSAALDLTTGAYTKSKTLRCTVTPSDADGSGSSNNVQVTIANAPPTLSAASEASSSSSGDLYATSSIILSYASANWDDPDLGDPKNLRYTISQQVGGTGSTSALVAGTITAGSFSATEVLTTSMVTKGDVLTFDYTPYDGTDTGTGPSTTSMTVVNKPPSVPTSVTMTPTVNAAFTSAAGASARAGKDDIVCSGTGSSDDDLDTVSYSYTWYLDDGDGLFDSGLDTVVDSAYLMNDGEVENRLDGAAVNSGVGTIAAEVYWCSVLAFDGEDYSDTSVETSHTVGVDCDVDDDTYDSAACTGGTDCDDSDPDINPGVTETHALGFVGDGIDQDCDGFDECYLDNDADGFAGSTTTTLPGSDLACSGLNETSVAPDFASGTEDCDDNAAQAYPGYGSDPCDGLDNDCDTLGVPDSTEIDGDGDGYVECGIEGVDCEDYVAHDAMNAVWSTTWNKNTGGSLDDYNGTTIFGGCDCNDVGTDGNAVTQAPGFPEICEALGTQLDSDCDGDANTSNGVPVTGSAVYYIDKDDDGFGFEGNFSSFCNQPDGYSANKEDCDDQNPDINPLADETCNDTDDDCDGSIDNDDYQDLGDTSGCLDLFRDSDRDLYGDEENIVCLCPTDDSSDDTGDDETSGLIIVELGSEQYISRQGDCYDVNPDIYPGSGDDEGLDAYLGEEVEYNENFDSIAERRFEVMDGHDNNCDGYVPLIELDCDSDGSFVKLPEDIIPDEVSRYDEVGLAPCWDTVAGLDPEAPQLGADGEALDLPTINCAGQNLALECDPFTRLWVIDRDSLEDYSGGFRENRPGNVAHGDCDDICPDRFPGNGETCDGLDNDCSDYAPDSEDPTPYYADSYNPDLPERLWDEMDRDGVPDGMDAEIERIGTVTIEEFDIDQDGYIGCGDSIGSLREQVVPTSLSCTIDGFDLEYDEEQKEDCNNTCALTTPVAIEACNGFADTCVGDTEGTDGDADDAVSCGIGSLNSGASLEEEVFVLTYFQDVEEDPSTGSAGPDNLNSAPQNGNEAVDTGWFLGSRRGNFDTVECDAGLMSVPLAVKDVSTMVPMLLPRAVPPSDVADWELGPDDIVVTDQLLKQHLNALVGDESVDQAVRELEDRLAGRLEERDPLLDFCACVNGFESGERDCDEWRDRGRCAVLKVSLSSTADEDIDLLVDENGCVADYPEQIVTRSVWNPVRIQEARQRVVEWECLQLYGKTCSEIAATGTPDAINIGGATEDCSNLVDDDGDGLADCDDPECTTSECINTELGTTPATDWWLELGRHNVSVVTEGSLMGCWGDPTDGIDQIDATTGGDCDNADPLATRYNPEGPGDLYGRFWDLELDCSTCLDGVDNNCDGQTDCADPGCAACFVGQGFGVGGGSEASCAQLGCSSTGLSRSQTLGGLAMAFLALGLVGAGRRRRRSVA